METDFRMTSWIRYATLLWAYVQFDIRILAFSQNRRRISSYISQPSLPMPPQYLLKSMPRKDCPFCAEAYAEITEEINPSSTARTRRLDRDISAREWMEGIEKYEGSIYGIGAYSVLRCDVAYPATCSETNNFSNSDSRVEDTHDFHWNVWGIDFHMDRLCSSYAMLLNSHRLVRPCSFKDESLFEETRQQSEEMIKVLLEEAAKSLCEENTSKKSDQTNTAESTDLQDQNTGVNLHRTLMLTLLWTPPKHDPTNHLRPTVRGHASFAGPSRPSMEDQMPQAISACLSIPNELTPEAHALLPHRHIENSITGTYDSIGASAKISSWCRVRRPLEDPSVFKVPGMNVGEVLLVGNSSNASSDFIASLEILEGLTSNFFVIYTDGTVRTAPATKVLPGYSRFLVIKSLLKMGQQLAACNGRRLIFEDSAPTVQDALSGLWSEVFVTSAIRLLIPVNRILIPSVKILHEYTTTEMTTIWQGDRVSRTTDIRRAIFRIGLDESAIFPSAHS